MKNKILAISLFSLVGITAISCNNDDDSNVEVVNYDTVPENSKNFITEFFPNHTISIVEKNRITAENGAVYEVIFSNRDEVEFDANGNWVKVEAQGRNSIPTGFILPNIVNYITTNYPTTSIHQIEKKAFGFEVELTNDLDLIFDAKGEFVRIDY